MDFNSGRRYDDRPCDKPDTEATPLGAAYDPYRVKDATARWYGGGTDVPCDSGQILDVSPSRAKIDRIVTSLHDEINMLQRLKASLPYEADNEAEECVLILLENTYGNV